MTCPTPCERDCNSDCHELHFPTWHRDHRYEDCPGRWSPREVAADLFGGQ